MKSLLQKSGYLATVGLLGTYGLYQLRGPQGISALMEKRERVHEMEIEKATLTAEIQQKKELIEKLKHNAAAQDGAIREGLQWAEPGELQFVLPEKAPVK